MKFRYTKPEIILETLCALCAAAMIAVYIALIRGAPEQIPVHYGISGQPDRWGKPTDMVLVLVLGLFLYAIMSGCTFLTARAGTSNAFAVHMTRKLLQWCNLTTLAMMVYIIFTSLKGQPLGAVFLPVYLVVMLVPTAWMTVLLIRGSNTD